MRLTLLPVAVAALAAAVAAAMAIGKALEGVPALLATVESAPPPAVPAPAPARPDMQVTPVDAAQFRDVQKRPMAVHGAVVLDLERLESVDAAQAMAQYRSDTQPAGAPLVCWLAARTAAEAAAASLALARTGCAELRVVD